MPKLRTAAIVAAILILASSIYWNFQTVGFKNLTQDNILSLFGQLLLIALFVERSVEFFVDLWRETDKDLLAYEVEKYKKKLKKPTKNADIKLQDKLQKKERQLLMYKSQTLRIAHWASFLFGLLISAVGIRSLEPLVSMNISELVKSQQSIFYFTDMLLTGCLIAGGSEALHKIANVYNNFMDTTAKLAEEKPARAAKLTEEKIERAAQLAEEKIERKLAEERLKRELAEEKLKRELAEEKLASE